MDTAKREKAIKDRDRSEAASAELTLQIDRWQPILDEWVKKKAMSPADADRLRKHIEELKRSRTEADREAIHLTISVIGLEKAIRPLPRLRVRQKPQQG